MTSDDPPRQRPRRVLARFRPCLVDALRGYRREDAVRDLGAGLTVGIVALPLAMAFAIASGLQPAQGLVSAIVGGFLVSALGGSRLQIGGPAGAFIVVVYGILQREGLTHLLIATAMAGALLFTMGLLRLGSLVRFIPVAIVIGFTNGIAVLIALSQVRDLLGLPIDRLPAEFFAQLAALAQALPRWDPLAAAMGMGCLAVVVAWPRTDRLAPPGLATGLAARLRRLAGRIPGTVIALVGATALTAGLDLPLATIGSRFGGIPAALPRLDLPPVVWEDLQPLWMPAVTLALLGAIESLLCARVADTAAAQRATGEGLPPPPRHDPNQELMAQGVANLVVPLLGGLPVTGTIARTVTNVRAGARSPVAGMVHALVLLTVVLAAAPLAIHVPLAALAGLLMFVAWNMGEWRQFAHLRRFRMPYRLVLLGTFGLTVVFDLTVAVEVGLVLACGFFIVRMGRLFQARPMPGAPSAPGVQGVELYGSLFFGAVDKIDALEAVPAGTRTVVLDLHRLVSMDSSGLQALQQLHASLQRQGIELRLARAEGQPLALLLRSGWLDSLGADRVHATLAEACHAPVEPAPAALGPPIADNPGKP